MPIPIYHITKLDNLPAILASGRLIATNRLRLLGARYASIAFDNIQERRSRTRVPCGEGGTLHDYVPFYFAPRSPMLYTINRGNVASCPEGQSRIVHLVVDAEEVATSGLRYVFTDGHAVMGYSRFFTDLADMNAIDWEVMRARYWYDTDQDGDRKRRRQAEFLIHEQVPWSLIREICVLDRVARDLVLETLRGVNEHPPVVVRSGWYY